MKTEAEQYIWREKEEGLALSENGFAERVRNLVELYPTSSGGGKRV